MVTTRGQSREPDSTRKSGRNSGPADIATRSPESNEEEDVFYTPATERGDHSGGTGEDDVFYTPAAKRRKILPVREKLDKPHPKTRVVVEIPVSAKRPDPTTESASKGAQDNKIGKHGKEGELQQVTDASIKVEEPAAPEEVRTDSSQASSPPALGRGHIRLGSQEPVQLPPPTALVASQHDQSVGESSDDDAPEVVATKDALKSTRDRDREAIKAVYMQETANRKKRKEHDTFLKQQAELASKKRKREEEALEDGPNLLSSGYMPAETLRSDNHASATDHTDDMIGERPSATQATATQIPLDLHKLPELLPLEYLEDGDEAVPGSSDVVELPKTSSKKKKMKLLKLAEKEPKDRCRGKTIYRVLKSAHNSLLAPKASGLARSSKEAWLAGRSGNKTSAQRKAFKSGFFTVRR